MLNENHIINKQVFEFTCSQTGHAFQLQKQMDSGLQYQIQSAINGLLNECDESGEIISIEKLEIDLGEIPFDKFADLLPQKFYASFTEKLSSSVITNKILPGANKTNKDHHTIELLETFLLSGNLPWQAGTSQKFSYNETMVSLLKDNPAGLKSFLLKHIFDATFLDRLFYQTDANLLQDIIGLFPALLQCQVMIEDVAAKVSIATIKNTNQLLSLQNTATITCTEIEQAVDVNKNIPKIILQLLTKNPLPVTVEHIKFLIKEKMKELFKNSIEINCIEESIDNLDSNDISSLKELVNNQTTEREKPQNLLYQHNSIKETGEKTYIQNAGLVLMATFLPALFKELQWTDEGGFKSRELQLKALFLLHYICTGDVAAPEYTLQLNKILCGLDLEEPIPFSVALNEAEKQEAEQLLADIIGHWAALKNSSAEALRGSFLLRDALLSYKNDHWLLQVERKGYDILLDHIPWSWQTIRFNWMKTYIEVEW